MSKELKLPFASPYTKAQVQKFNARKAGKMGTVGAVALDNKGRLAAATSTGGRGFEYPHRVSDSPTSAGTFANGVGAVSATGIGEQIVEFSAASTICAYLESGQSLNQAIAHLLKRARKAKAEFSFIALNSRGRYLPATTTSSLIWAAATNDKLDFMLDTKAAYR
jgi:L-asparaginase